MDWQNEKCVMVVDGSLPLGIIANTAAIMGITCNRVEDPFKRQTPEAAAASGVEFF